VIVEVAQPYDFALSLERYRTFGPDLLWLWRDDVLHRVIDGVETRISAAPEGVRVEPANAALAAPLRRILGEVFDIAGFRRFALRDPFLRPVIQALPGFRPPVAPNAFEQLLSSITAQQVSLHAARAVRNRLVERCSIRVGEVYAAPTPAAVAALDPIDLLRLGFSRRKAGYALALARADLDFGALAALPDEEVIDRVMALPGIGRWTAEWFLARHLARPDVWPAGDLGLRKAVARFVHGREDATEAETRAAGERFRPYRNLAAHYLLTGMRMTQR
jgi:DNA-3-methyladenine glycosylase II